jgi:uncharacterized protein YqgV (UPF0045/DUF77 family)
MSAEIASLDRVRAAVANLRQAGSKVTANRVIEAIGGGSKGTVIAHLRTLRSQSVDHGDLPPAIIEMARSALADVFEAGRKAEADKLRGLSEHLSAALDEQDAQIGELIDENENLGEAVAAAMAKVEQVSAENTTLESRIGELMAANTALNEMLAAERERGARDMKVAITRIENAILRKAGGNIPNNKRRRTLSLPLDRTPGD